MYFFIYLNLATDLSGEKVQQEQNSFLPKYSVPNSMFTSDSSIYLPPEFYTSNSHLDQNNFNKFPFKLPSSYITNIPNVYTTPYGIILTSTMNYDDKFDIDNNKDGIKINVSSPTPSSQIFNDQTNKSNYIQEAEKRTVKAIPSVINYNHPVEVKIDTKHPRQFSTFKESTSLQNQKPAEKAKTRSVSVSAENGMNQELDQKASFRNEHFISPPKSILIHSTTETAIPILRLSNEMDLDGSFSYEALGADQTHYVQHSRMENLGTDKEAQIVEGSYSYIGDNGQTYTVHYIADSNGFRATGDHLPVAPPIPEIIQRSIQYNLAEEAKKPSLLNDFYDDGSDNTAKNTENNQKNSLSSQKHLFTGRTPEAFSLGFSQGSNSQNNLTPIASPNEPLKVSSEFSGEKIKRNFNKDMLEPQITFSASQGAHSPSLNTPQKSTMPQLINYESRQTESEQENTEALWRRQYELNSNIGSQNPSKDSISRSFGEEEDVIINFSDLTPEQYRTIIRNQLTESSQTDSNNDLITNRQIENAYNYYNKNISDDSLKLYNSNIENNKYNDNNYNYLSALQPDNKILLNGPDQSRTQSDTNTDVHHTYNSDQHYADLITKSTEKVFVSNDPIRYITPTTESMPQSIDFLNTSFEAKKSVSFTSNKTKDNTYLENKYFPYTTFKPHANFPNNNERNNKLKGSPINEIRATNNIIPTNYNNLNQYNEFKPLLNTYNQNKTIQQQNKKHETNNLESNINDDIRNNIFLKNLFKSETNNPRKDGFTKQSQPDINTKGASYANTLNSSKYINNELKFYNEQLVKNKPFNISDVLNYVSNKNIFESNKLRNRSKSPLNINSFSQATDSTFNTNSEENKVLFNEPTFKNFIHHIHPHDQELRGIIKNYKVLHRNNTKTPNLEKNSKLQSASRIQNLDSFKLPPLGRAGPSVKSYLPPINFYK
ncbi:unnamed protein product [Parnassius mnemosyne]|uniref:Uncharacterized protein n=1 Tax=Parnassius mnemosyne TaxID=213953 RepID=A0AAV1KD65_9NEOP